MSVISELSSAGQIKVNGFGRFFSSPMKRLFDIVVSALGLVFLSPVFLIISVLIKRQSQGPVFYGGTRAGKDKREFTIWKFRTMVATPESLSGPQITSADDKRITPLGSWLRDTKINELPQLWNVLMGDMSLVGPRPENYEIAMKWPEDAQDEYLVGAPGHYEFPPVLSIVMRKRCFRAMIS